MQRPHPGRHMTIPVSMPLHSQLVLAATRTGFAKEDWEIAAEAIDEWMRRHDPETISMPVTSGYQWKQVFLPSGTVLRTVFGGKNYHCMVEGDQILYQKQAVSPSAFVNAAGGVRRNAWLSTWILFPDAKEWKLADTLRTRTRPARPVRHHRPSGARAFPAPGRPDGTPSQSAPAAPSEAPTQGISASAAPRRAASAPDARPSTGARGPGRCEVCGCESAPLPISSRRERRAGTCRRRQWFAGDARERRAGPDHSTVSS